MKKFFMITITSALLMSINVFANDCSNADKDRFIKQWENMLAERENMDFQSPCFPQITTTEATTCAVKPPVTEATTNVTTEVSTEQTTCTQKPPVTETTTNVNTEVTTEQTTAAQKPTVSQTTTNVTTEVTTEQTTAAQKPTVSQTTTNVTTEVTTEQTTATQKPTVSQTTTNVTTEATTEQTTAAQKPTVSETTTEATTAAGDNSSTNANTYAKQVLSIVNQHRRAAGLKELTLSTELNNVAQAKSEDMRKNNYFSHTSPTYGSPFDMLKGFGISYRYAGENIAKGQTTAAQVMNDWMNSDGHRANILNSNFGKMGLGYSNGYWTQIFTD